MPVIQKICCALFFSFLFYCSAAQYKLNLIITKLPSYHRASDPVYLVGNFNNWNPSDEKMQLRKTKNHHGITIELPKGMYEYKFTAGGWNKVETEKEGFPTENRVVHLESDTTIEAEIAHWADHFPKAERKSTASKNVHLIDTAFYIPQLNRHRRV